MIGGAKGIGIGIDFGIPNQYCRATSKPYIEKDVLDSLRIVASAYGKSNDDADRSIVKNLVDPDNPFVISNAAYTEGSGYADKDSPYYGAFVTDGIDDLITSTKTVQEMLGGSNEITVVSMAHFIKGESKAPEICRINQIRRDTRSIRNSISKIGKSGIFGYTYKNGVTTINNILGNKNDCTAEGNLDGIVAPFSVEGYYYNNNSNPLELCSIAWYWTIIANKVLITDQINQVIAYFNLDRTLKPDILCNTIKQGITNENHAEFGDKLIDFSGNGRDIQLNNIAWNKESGIDDDGALRLDGVNDFGKVTGMPIYKDYTFIIEREFLNETFPNQVCLVSKSKVASEIENGGAFIVDNISVNSIINPYSFYKTTSLPGLNTFDRQIVFQSKYKYLDKDIAAGTATDSDTLWLGTFRDNDSRFANVAIYSLMSFPYSMSKFLIERQLKKYKLGTLYPDMVEFRPIVKSNNKWDIIEIWQGDKSLYRPTINDDKTGIYLKKDSTIGIYVKPYVGQKVSEIVYNGVSYTDLKLNSNGFYYITVPVTKSPQKIGITIEQDENYVLFNPVITSNVEYHRLDFYLNNYQKIINIGDYIPKDAYLRANIYLNNNVDELTAFIFNGVNIGYRRSSVDDTAFNISHIYNYDSPQEVNITIDEYIRYEDIVQPYPVLLRFNDENGNEVSWGGKFRVGSTITIIGSIADPESNLLNGLYSISGLSLNGKAVTSSTSIVEKQMVFKTTTTWLLDNNEPNCILSPRLLRIPNSSYKILGHIPDISGHGNHGVIHNSAYGEGSGVNEDGSYQFDGVDDFVTIPTLSGGKQVLMKVNWQKEDGMIYNQNPGQDNFAIFANDYNGSNVVNAYASRNNGSTYIDGILNNNILATQLKNVTHNITITNENVINNTIIPVIGANAAHNNFYSQMALYDLMLFDEISTDDKIKELNEYVGIEAKVELPPYYWDAYGKTNLDEDKATIRQRGVAIGDYDLINNNFAYEGMSGYNGYPAVFGTNKTYANLVPNDGNFILTSSHNIINVTKFDTSYGLLYSHIKLDGKLTSRNIDYPSYKIKVTGLGENFGLHYSYLESSSDTTVKGFEINNDGIYIIPKSFASDGSLTSNSDWIGFIFTGTAPESCNVTIEVLPEYENGLVYDGVTDYSENANIPAFTDFTAIAKKLTLSKKTSACSISKGKYPNSAFLLEYQSTEDELQYYSYGTPSKQPSTITPEIVYATPTSYNGNNANRGTNNDNSGLCIGKINSDNNYNYWNGVFYKLILYPKTIPLLQINFLKNLMERDEIIDLNNKIFIQ